MPTFPRILRAGLFSAFPLLFLGGAADSADRATARGRIEAVDPPTRQIKLQMFGGGELTVTADAASRLSVDGRAAPLAELRPGRRVRVTFEKAGDVNRLVALRTVAQTQADLSRDIRAALDSARGYTFAQKEKYEEKLRAVIDDVDDRLDDLQERAQDAATDVRPKLDAQIKDLRRTRDEVEKRLDRAKPAAADAWDDLKTGVGTAADDLQQALDRLRGDPTPAPK